MGTGVDSIRIERIQSSIEQYGETFLSRVFTGEERAYCREKPDPSQHFAARFAGKEAVMKVVGIGWEKGVSWRDIEIHRPEGNRPIVRLTGRLGQVADDKKINHIHISLTHDSERATAFAIGERRGGSPDG